MPARWPILLTHIKVNFILEGSDLWFLGIYGGKDCLEQHISLFVAVFLGCTSTGPVGLMVFVVLCPGTPEGSTGSGSGFKASQKTGQRLKVSSDRLGEAGNRTCDPWFTRHISCCLLYKTYCYYLTSFDIPKTILKCISKQNVLKVYHVAQEL